MLPKEIACNRISLEPNVLIFGSNSTYTSRLIQWIYRLKPGLITLHSHAFLLLLVSSALPDLLENLSTCPKN